MVIWVNNPNLTNQITPMQCSRLSDIPLQLVIVVFTCKQKLLALTRDHITKLWVEQTMAGIGLKCIHTDGPRQLLEGRSKHALFIATVNFAWEGLIVCLFGV